MTRASAPSQRMLRAGELIRHALAEVIARNDTGDPELDRFIVTINEVQMSPDLKIATAYVRAVKGGDNALRALERNRKYMRGLIAPKLDMKFMPELRFRMDTALDYASKIEEILHSPKVAQDLKKD
jgi:ribosome-binding factor A